MGVFISAPAIGVYVQTNGMFGLPNYMTDKSKAESFVVQNLKKLDPIFTWLSKINILNFSIFPPMFVNMTIKHVVMSKAGAYYPRTSTPSREAKSV